VEDYLFPVVCVTCQRRLLVRDESVIGDIITCPKCGSMVQITPPDDWKPKPTGPSTRQPPTPSDVPSEQQAAREVNRASFPEVVAELPPPPRPKATSESKVGLAARARLLRAQPLESSGATAALPEAPPPVAFTPGLGDGAAPPISMPGPPPVALSGPAVGQESGPSASGTWKWPLVVGVPVLGFAVALGAWAFLSLPREPEEVEASLEEPSATTTAPPEAVPSTPKAPPATGLDARWLPGQARLVISLHLAALAAQPETAPLIQRFDAYWRPSVGRVLDSFKLLPQNVEKFTWASADLRAWENRAVVVIELAEGQDAGPLAGLGNVLDWQVAGKPCRRMSAGWPHPFVILDPRTVISGPEDLLRGLSDRSEPQFQSDVLAQLVKSASPAADFLILLDLVAAREAGWQLPASLWDIWPAGRASWHAVCGMPQGLGLAIRRSNPGQSELALVCDGESTAMKVRDALGQFVPAARNALGSNAASLSQRLQAGRITVREDGQYAVLLKQGQAALAAAKWEIVDQTVLLRVDWGQHLPEVVTAALESQRLIRADWLEAARAADQTNHQRLAGSLDAYVKAEGTFPPGATGGALLPPDTRLSWIASMLPYFEHRDWYKELQPSYSWNSPQNRPVTQRRLDAVVNPALGPASTEAGFPVTHYVGVAGVGADAAERKANEPGAGLFGYSRTARREDLPRGAANTLATLGVSGQPGPWAAGGKATARALTKPPYVNGPDGFGSGQPDGMLAGMADGSVRFVSKNVDPAVLEQLAVVRGNQTTVAALGPPPAATAPTPPPAEAKAAPAPSGPAGSQVASNARPPGAGVPPAGAAKASGSADDGEGDEEPVLGGADDAETSKIDLKARLADRIPEIHFPRVPMVDAVRLMSQMSTIPISFDLDWMQAMGVGLRDPVTVQLAGATTGEIIEALVARRGLTCVPMGSELRITAPAKRRESLQTQKYEIADLAGKDAAAGSVLVEWVKALVSPENWREAGGQGSAEFAGGTLTVTQNDLVQAQVRDFLDRLRIARGKSPQARPDIPPRQNPTRLDLARAKLAQRITLNISDPAPLQQVAGDLERVSQTTILFDGPAMHAAGVSRQRKTALSIREQPVSAALVSMLHPLGLTYRIVDAATFEITTRKAAEARLELEFYDAAKWLAKPMAPEAVMEQVKSQVAGATWNDAGGPGAMVFDKASGCLLVLQSQPVQVKVQLFLAKP